MPKKVKINSFFKNKFLIILVVIGVAAGGAYAIINGLAATGVIGYSDFDNDGVTDVNDRCNGIVGSTSNQGCPLPTGGISAVPSTVAYGGTSTLNMWWKNGNCSLVGEGTYLSTGTKTISNITTRPSITYTMRCEPIYNYLSSGTGIALFSVTINVNAPVSPPPPPPPAPAPAPSPSPAPKKPTKKSGTSSKVIPNTATPTNPADTTKPTLPANLFAEQVGNGEVELTWDESTDAAGIDSYTVERSTDGIDWTILDDAVLINSYSDTTADFGVTYSYRVSAKDKSGNYSDYIQVDIETNSFSANIYADEDSTVTSEDDTVTVSFPAGSFSEDAYCEITKDTVKTNPKGYKLAAGGYIIECKNSQGDSISQLDKAAKVTMNLKSSKYKSYTAYSIDSDGKLEQIKSTFNSKSGELSFQISDLSNAFAAYGKSGGSAWWLWLIILLILILAVIAFIRWRRSRSESAEDAYYDSAGYVTMPPTAPVGPNGGGTGGYEQHTSLPDLVAQGQQQQQQPQQPYQEFPPAPPIQGQPGEFPEQDPNQYPPQPPTK